MHILKGLDGLRSLPACAVLSIGNFDGIHRGHRRILEVARRLRGDAGGAALGVATFEPHPLTVLRPELAPPRLTPAAIKEELLRREGVDYLVVLPPEPAVLNLTAEQFWGILRDEVRPKALVEGDSFNFGKGRGGTIQKLREWTAQSEVHLEVVEPLKVALLDMSLVAVSSSLIRWLLGNGRVRDAAICLGRPYVLEGPVIRGHQRGRAIGIPTANLDCGGQLVPADGVYVGRCEFDGRVWPAAASIGTMPTFGPNSRQVEAHLVGFDGDLYDRVIQVELVDWLRDQLKFASVDVLKAKMAVDIAQTVDLAAADPSRAIAVGE